MRSGTKSRVPNTRTTRATTRATTRVNAEVEEESDGELRQMNRRLQEHKHMLGALDPRLEWMASGPLRDEMHLDSMMDAAGHRHTAGVDKSTRDERMEPPGGQDRPVDGGDRAADTNVHTQATAHRDGAVTKRSVTPSATVSTLSTFAPAIDGYVHTQSLRDEMLNQTRSLTERIKRECSDHRRELQRALDMLKTAQHSLQLEHEAHRRETAALIDVIRQERVDRRDEFVAMMNLVTRSVLGQSTGIQDGESA